MFSMCVDMRSLTLNEASGLVIIFDLYNILKYKTFYKVNMHQYKANVTDSHVAQSAK